MKVKVNYNMMDPIEVYLLVCKGKLKKFPDNYLDKETIKKISRHVILDIDNFTRDEICKKVNRTYLSKNCMGGFVKKFNQDILSYINYCFPEFNIKGWELTKVAPKFWEDKKNQKEFMIYLFNKLNIDSTSKEDIRRLTAREIIKHGGSNALKKVDSYFELIQLVTKDSFKEWEVTKIKVWNYEKAVLAVRWLVEDKLKLDKVGACNLTVKDFAKNNLDGMLQNVFNHSILKALNAAYEDIYYRDGIRCIKLKK